jgi:hypothetical protein
VREEALPGYCDEMQQPRVRSASQVAVAVAELLSKLQPGTKAAEDAATLARHVRRPETAVLLHLPHGDGHLVLEGQDAAACRDIQVHRRQVPLLPQGHTAMAKLAQAQSFLQRLLY